MNRREVLAAMATIAGSVMLPGAATAGSRGVGARHPQRIDTHQHIVPDFYRTWLESKSITAGGLPIPTWSPSAALDLMDRNGISTGILSVSTPGVHLGNTAEARVKAREVNEYCAEVVDKYPGRFGFFATLTLPDVEGSIEEAHYALRQLKADGVILLANTHGIYLGTPEWDPLMKALNDAQANIFVHPSELPGPTVPNIPPYAVDFLLDTTRAALSIARSGALERYPQLKIILSHAGGFVPYAAERMARACSEDGSTEGGIRRLRKFYFDTALSGSPYALPSLLAFAEPDRITFGSDWPYASKERSSHFTELLDSFDFKPGIWEAVNRLNALQLFPRLA